MAGFPTRHPWLAASLGAHALLAAVLYTAGPVRVERKRDDGVRAAVGASLQQTAQREMRRQLRTMEEIKEALEQSAGVAADKPMSSEPAVRARELAAAIEQVRQKIRADEMARVLRIPEAEALERVKAEAAQRRAPPVPKNRPPEAVVAQLAAQARAALAERRAQVLAQRQGIAVNGPGRAPGAGPQGGADAHGDGKGGAARGGIGRSGSPSAATGGRLDALASGLGLTTPGALTGSSLDMSSDAFGDTRGYGEFRAPPPLDAARVRPGAGRVLGAGGPYASRVFVDTWYVIGPFEGQGRDSLKAVYPPERGVDLDAVYYGKNDLPVRWTYQQDSYPTVPRPRAEHAVYYAYTEITLDRDMDLWVWIGADDDSKMWFNDSLVWIGSQVDDKPWYRVPFYTMEPELATRNLTEGQRRLHFHKGRNTMLFKLYNGMDLMFFSVVLSR
ncbi:hypothetical protein [Massilia putida]|uniref:hypothetical protein n=1 Tax=Massilia putida TaxID=1141883 RepID=UPI0009529019|nr:hypothetical protein [Massilia putida]